MRRTDQEKRYLKQRKMDNDKAWLNQLLSQVQHTEWYGTLSFIFENGRIKRVRRDECLLPPKEDGR